MSPASSNGLETSEPPYGLSGGDVASRLNPLIAQGKAAAQAENTRNTYSTGWNSWARWAAGNGFAVFPATSDALEYWMADLWSQGMKPSSLGTYLTAVSRKHAGHPFPNPADHSEVRLLLSGLKRLTGRAGNTPKQADPLRWIHILEIIDSAYKPRCNQPGGRQESPEQAARRAVTDIAMICVAHDAALRCSELLALTWADVELPAEGEGGLVWIRRSKTDQNGQGAAVPISKFTAQALNRLRPDSARPGDRVFDISPSTVTRRIKAAAQAAGIDSENISSHSPRVGMAQDLVAFGIDLPGLIQACRWDVRQNGPPSTPRNIAAHHHTAAPCLKSSPTPPAPPPPPPIRPRLSIPRKLTTLPSLV